MKSATRTLASALGVYAGLLGATHGVLEILQGEAAVGGIMIQAIGPPCQMSQVWHGCWPAVTLAPNYLVSGVLAVVVSLVVAVWAAFLVQRKRGGLVLTLLSLVMLPVGGGIIPVLIGTIAGSTGTRINAPLAGRRERGPGSLTRILARLWPWPLAAYFVWIPCQWFLGRFLNEFMLQQGFLLLLFEFGLLLLSVAAGLAHDAQRGNCDDP